MQTRTGSRQLQSTLPRRKGARIPQKTSHPEQLVQIGGGGTYAAVGARIWLPPERVGMIVDKGHDFPPQIQRDLESYGKEMWLFRDQPEARTTRALNTYRGDFRSFEYLTPRIRITPRDLSNTKLDKPEILHFICSPARASVIMSEVRDVEGWNPIAIYEPIPDRCVPDELPALIKVLPSITILSPNAEEAYSLLSLALPVTKPIIEQAAEQLLQFGVKNAVIIRSGHMGAYVTTREFGGQWIDAYWTESIEDACKVIDVTGGGNSFLGGLAAGLHLSHNDVYEAAYYAAVSASFIIEQGGLPAINAADDNGNTRWNNDSARRRLEVLKSRHSAGNARSR